MTKFSKIDFYYVFLAISMLILDQIVKIKIKSSMKLGESIDIIRGFFSLTYVQNKGAAFGIFQNQKWIFLLIGTIMIVVLIDMFIKSKNILSKISISLIVSGAVGNMTDRLIYGYVIDMLDFHAIWSYVFNIADICVVVGIFLLSIQTLFIEK